MITSHQPFTVTFTTKVIEAYSQLGRLDPRPSCPCAPRMGIPLSLLHAPPGQGPFCLHRQSLGVIAQPGPREDRTSLDSLFMSLWCNSFNVPTSHRYGHNAQIGMTREREISPRCDRRWDLVLSCLSNSV
ncbi:hypothetical protein NXS19_013126, partial [Fusarium pseudograminearum]